MQKELIAVGLALAVIVGWSDIRQALSALRAKLKGGALKRAKWRLSPIGRGWLLRAEMRDHGTTSYPR